MRIDCAVGLCDRAQFSYPWAPHRDYTAEDLGPILARNRFDGAIMHGQTGGAAETDWLLALAQRHAWIHGVVTRVDNPLDWDRWQASPKFLGVEGAAPALASQMHERGLVCVTRPVHALAQLEAAPSGRVSVSAMAGVSFAFEEFDDWTRRMEPFASSAAMIQIDGLLNGAGAGRWQADTYRPWVQHLLEVFGPARILYGSGWPLSMPHSTWKESLACFTQAMGARTMDDRGLILGENAARFYSRRVRVGYTEGSPG